MEQKNIPFQYGIHRSPSAAAEGELSECVNLEVHNGELTPSVMPQVAFTLAGGDKLLFVHKTGSYKNYIIQRGTNLCWFSDEDKSTVNTIKGITPTSIHSVGNTLIVLSENSMEYILYKSGTYKPIGNKPPFCSISFGLACKDDGIVSTGQTIPRDELVEIAPEWVEAMDSFMSGEALTISHDMEDSYKSLASYGTAVAEASSVVSLVNKFTEVYQAALQASKATKAEEGYFYDSFFIRYAYRMYDGSHYMQSAPIFFPICTDGYPSFLTLGKISVDGEISDTLGTVGLLAAVPRLQLNYRIVGFYSDGTEVEPSDIEDWSDIIKGVDIFASKGQSVMTSDSKVYGFSNVDFSPSGIYYLGSAPSTEDTYSIKGYNHIATSKDLHYLKVEKDTNEDFMEKIRETSVFHKISSLGGTSTIRKLYGKERTVLAIKKGILTNLEQQETLEDDYDSHNAIIPSFAHTYNGRLNISGIRTKQFEGFPMEAMVPYSYIPGGTNYTWSVKAKLEIEGRTIEVVSRSNISLHGQPAYVYFPSAKAEKLTLYMYTVEDSITSSFSATFDTEVHKFLNGAFYLSPTFGVGDSYTLDITAANPQPSGDPYVSYPNKLYTSEVNNPYYFPLAGRNSIGTGEIIAVTSNTKAISPGQFGEYPLIVFSTDGVWALQVNDEGLYFGVHPISKDICSNASILQTDAPVIFASANGLHSITGDNIQLISAHLKGQPDNITMPSVSDATFTALATQAKDTLTFTQYIQGASFAFDYANSRILAYRPDKAYAYIISTADGSTSKLVLIKDGNPVSLESAVQAYPEVYMQSGTDIYTFVSDTDTSTTPTSGMLVTRPMSFSDPLAMKVLNQVRLIYRKTQEDTRCSYALYASNDGYNWMQRTSLRGHSFKYFRFVIFTSLADNDALQGMSVKFDYRRTHKLR